MKTLLSICAFLLLSTASAAQELSEIPLPPNGDAEKAEVSQWIGLARVSITYHSPRVHRPADNDRTGHIWGELVRYGFFDDGFGPSKATPWRAGANENTIITLSHDVRVQGKDLKAGTYALFLELAENGPLDLDLLQPFNWLGQLPIRSKERCTTSAGHAARCSVY